jgi:hypothetical protein
VAYIPAIKGDIQLQGGNIGIYSSRSVYLIIMLTNEAIAVTKGGGIDDDNS